MTIPYASLSGAIQHVALHTVLLVSAGIVILLVVGYFEEDIFK